MELEDSSMLGGTPSLQLSGSFVNDTFRSKVHHLASVTKGILSLLVGIAIDKDFINDVNDPISKYLPEFEKSFNANNQAIRVRDLITMHSGWEWEQFRYKWDDKRNNAAEMYR